MFVSLAPTADRSDSGGEPREAAPVGGGGIAAMFEAKLGSKQIEKYAPATLIVVLALLSMLVVLLVNIKGSLQASEITLARDDMVDVDDGSPRFTLSPVMVYDDALLLEEAWDESLRKIAQQPRVLGSGEGGSDCWEEQGDCWEETCGKGCTKTVCSESTTVCNTTVRSAQRQIGDEVDKLHEKGRRLVTPSTPAAAPSSTSECTSAPTYSTLTCQAFGGDFTTENYCNEEQGTFHSETCGLSLCGCCVEVG